MILFVIAGVIVMAVALVVWAACVTSKHAEQIATDFNTYHPITSTGIGAGGPRK
jgi:hypothetical protein